MKSDILSCFVVRYLDAREMWIPNDFAAHCFVLVMYSIQVLFVSFTCLSSTFIKFGS